MKKFIISVLSALLLAISLMGCHRNDTTTCPFAGVTWTRTTEADTEFIVFGNNGSFSYWCACGNPVNDSDICNGYKYDPDTNTIRLLYDDSSTDGVINITVVEYSDDRLILDFDGDRREFFRAISTDEAETIEYKGDKFVVIKFDSDIFCFELADGREYDSDIIYEMDHSKWKILYFNGNIYALQTEIHEFKRFYTDDTIFNFSITISHIDLEESYYYEINISESEINELKQLANSEEHHMITFDEIKCYAILTKTSNDRFLKGTCELIWHDNTWFWRSGNFDESTEGWPEYVVPLPNTISEKVGKPKFNYN